MQSVIEFVWSPNEIENTKFTISLNFKALLSAWPKIRALIFDHHFKLIPCNNHNFQYYIECVIRRFSIMRTPIKMAAKRTPVEMLRRTECQSGMELQPNLIHFCD